MSRMGRPALMAATLTAMPAVFAAATPQARAFDATGTWPGTLNCTGFDGTKQAAKFTTLVTAPQPRRGQARARGIESGRGRLLVDVLLTFL